MEAQRRRDPHPARATWRGKRAAIHQHFYVELMPEQRHDLIKDPENNIQWTNSSATSATWSWRRTYKRNGLLPAKQNLVGRPRPHPCHCPQS
jgi:hypothetical protein